MVKFTMVFNNYFYNYS